MPDAKIKGGLFDDFGNNEESGRTFWRIGQNIGLNTAIVNHVLAGAQSNVSDAGKGLDAIGIDGFQLLDPFHDPADLRGVFGFFVFLDADMGEGGNFRDGCVVDAHGPKQLR